MNTSYMPIMESYRFPSGVEIKNRVLMAPMTNYSSYESGEVSDSELAYYKERSGGVGAVITACAYVTKDGKGFPGEFSADDDSFIPSLRKLAQTIQNEGSKAILQIFHGGRMCPPELLPDQQPVSASAVPADMPGAAAPREMTGEEIDTVIYAFGEATRRAIEAGFDGVEIHGANNYLLQQFFSPHSNRREDQWGGSIEKRMAFPLAVVKSVKQAIGNHAKKPFIIGYRLSPEEGSSPGITMDDTLHFTDRLAEEALDYLHISVMHFWNGTFRNNETSQSRVIKIHEHVGSQVPVIGVGSLHTPDDVLKALQTGVPLVALGRELLMEPKWMQKVEAGQENLIRTTLPKTAQKELIIPDQLWSPLISRTGWLPVVDE